MLTAAVSAVDTRVLQVRMTTARSKGVVDRSYPYLSPYRSPTIRQHYGFTVPVRHLGNQYSPAKLPYKSTKAIEIKFSLKQTCQNIVSKASELRAQFEYLERRDVKLRFNLEIVT